MLSTQLKLDFPNIQTRLTDVEVDQLSKAIRSATALTMGPYLKEFEKNFADYLNIKFAFGLSSCTAALEIAAMISNIGPNDEILVPAHTFTASALPFLRKKAKIVFVDIHPETFVMDLQSLKNKLSPRSKVIVPVHLYGLPIAMDEVLDIATEKNLIVIEDCAQSPGAEYKGKKVGTFGDFGCFSFHGQKNITTLGEGGMLVTNNDKYCEKILGLRKIGARPFIDQEQYWKPAMSNIVEAIPGEYPHNFGLGEIQAFAGILLLKRIEQINAIRRRNTEVIVKELADFPELQFQKIPSNCLSAHHLLPAKYNGGKYNKNRDSLIEQLYSQFGIKCAVQYYPLYRYELFKNNGYSEKDFCPNTEDFFNNMISFPFSTDMSSEDLQYLIDCLKKSLQKLRG
ncbi:MAG: DegT/DnrJ/EryC1/StrS family aminotransferase [Oligoflexia bacterium]|nr:DegT/DnrJ/EryC1/StrS family aminotransferase [Oligoflexia bacterium]